MTAINSKDQMVLSTCTTYLQSLKMPDFSMEISLQHDPEATIALTNINDDIYNSVFIHQPSNDEKLMDELCLIKNQLNRPLTIWLDAKHKNSNFENLLKQNFKSPGPFYGMVLEVNQASLYAFADEITIETVENLSQAKEYAIIFAQVFGFNHLQKHIENWLIEQNEARHPEALNYIAKVNGVPAGISSLILDKNFKQFKVGGFYNAGVLPTFRKFGVGTFMACHRVEIAKKTGIEYLSVLLMSNVMAKSYCECIGFKNVQMLTPYYI